MRIPRYWAEARIQRRRSGRQLTVRRFGWSDDSAEDAQRHANERVEQAFEAAWADSRIPRREPKVAYNGVEGMPIREEIVAEHGSTIITRNSYGALCLNTPDVLFADVDYPTEPTTALGCFASILAAIVATVACIRVGSTWLALLAGPIALLVVFWLSRALRRAWWRLRGGLEAIATRRIERLADRQRDWLLRVYRTPAGLRVLALHDVFDPSGEAAVEIFSALKSDPLYVTMCRRQACFRARVSPKPWRIEMPGRVKPRPGVWPLAEERLAERRKWVAEYEKASQNFAACEYVTSFGFGGACSKARAVQELHDELCRATSGLPVA